MELHVIKREQIKKSESNRIRREGNIPAVVYFQGKESYAITVNGTEFSNHMRTVISGRLSTTICHLKDENGKTQRALIKDIQYEITTYKIQHLDFEVLSDNVMINLNVPIECSGVVDCVGVKLGGVLRQVIRSLRIRCFPKDIPTSFVVDVKTLGQNETKKLSDLVIPHTIKPFGNLNEVAIIIAKR